MKFDLHIHSCLSPCANLEMSPSEIVQRAVAAGMGLSNSKRVADSFDIQSEVGKFTKVTCTFNLNPPEAAAPAGGAQ